MYNKHTRANLFEIVTYRRFEVLTYRLKIKIKSVHDLQATNCEIKRKWKNN